MKEALHKLGDFVERLNLKDMGQHTALQAKRVIRDTIAVILAGSNEPQINNLYEFAIRNGSVDEATVFGKRNRVSPPFAAMVNGAAGSTKELEEGNSLVFGHPAIQIVPAAIAAAEVANASGQATIEGLVAGYEIGGRISRASRIRKGFHPSGTWGTIGATTAAAKIAGLPACDIIEIINTASSFAISSNIENSFTGQNISQMYAALSNYLGIFSYYLHFFGFHSAPDNLGVTFGKLLSDNLDKSILLKDLGTKYLIDKNYFKMHPCCRYSHSALDAMEKILKRHTINPETVDRVEVSTFSQALHPSNMNPQNADAVRFSLPYLLAIAILKGEIEDHYIVSYRHDLSALESLVQRIFIKEENAFNENPMKRPTRIKIHLKRGGTLEAFVENCRGGYDLPYADAQLVEKFTKLAAPALGLETCEKVIRILDNLENLEEIRSLTGLLRIG